MASPGVAPLSVSLEGVHGPGAVPTQALLAAMLRASEKVSDLIFSPGRAPQVEVNGQLIPVHVEGLAHCSPRTTRARIAADLIGNNKQAINMLREQGSCDISYGLPGLARFRVNVFIQRGSCAVVMRVIPTAIPEFRVSASSGSTGRRQQLAQRHRAGDRAHGFGQVFDPGRAARPHQSRTVTITSSPSKIRSSSCITTSEPPFTSANCTAIRRISRWRCAPRCARRPR